MQLGARTQPLSLKHGVPVKLAHEKFQVSKRPQWGPETFLFWGLGID